MLNAPNALAQCLSFLLRGVIKGGMSWERLRSFLGRLQWVARPKCFLQPFMAGAYREVQAGSDIFPRRLLQALATVFVFACLPFSCPPPPPARRDVPFDAVFFSDAAPEGACLFRAGLVSKCGM